MSPLQIFRPELLGRFAASIGQAFGDLLFPHECQICLADDVATPFCDDCRGELLQAAGTVCPRCAEPVGPFTPPAKDCSACRKKKFGFDSALALGPYEGPIRELCLRMKSVHDAWLTRWVGDLVFEARRLELQAVNAAAVVAVPLHWRRRIYRGYNQAEVLAKRVARGLSLPLADALKRTVHTPKLLELGRMERARVMDRSFRASLGARFVGKTIILVDDILTSGATCGGAARALKRAGAKRVVVVVVGRA